MLTNCLAACTHLSQQFPSYSNRKYKKSLFSRTAALMFVSPGDAPATITQYVAWMERQFNACQTPRSMYLSIFNTFRVIRWLSKCVSPKIAIFTTFLFPPWGGRPCGNNVKCDMDGKRIGTDGHRGDRLLMYTHVAHVVSATATHMGDGCDMRISYSVHNKYSIAVADERQWVQLFLWVKLLLLLLWAIIKLACAVDGSRFFIRELLPVTGVQR